MPFNYESIRDDVVIKQIANFGKDAVLTTPGTTTGPAWAPIPGTPVAVNAKVLELGQSGSAYGIMNDPQSLMRSDDRRFLMSTHNSPTPAINGTLSIGGEVLQIVSVDASRPGTVLMFWKVRCRR